MSYGNRRPRRQEKNGAGLPTRTPPGEVEIERMLIASLIVDNDLIPKSAPVLSETEFYAPSTREAYREILKLWVKGEPVNLATLSQVVQQKSASEIASWAENCLPSNAPSYMQIVKKTAFARRLLGILQQAEEGIFIRSADIQNITATLVTELVTLQADDRIGDFMPVSKAVTEGIKLIERGMAGERGLPIGLAAYDHRVGGLWARESVVIAGRPGMGKTALALTIVINVAKLGVPVAFISAEMPAAQIAIRIIAGETQIENRNLRRGEINDDELNEIIRCSSTMGSLPLWILDSDRSWPRLEAKIRSLKLREPNLGLVVLDYIGLINVPDEEERYRELGIISAGAKQLAMDLRISFVLCSQLNRNVENRPNKQPQLADLRESGNLEQDADVVILLNRPSYYDADYKPRDLAFADVVKNRNGTAGMLKLRFDEKTVSFSDWIEPAPAMRDFNEPKETRL